MSIQNRILCESPKGCIIAIELESGIHLCGGNNTGKCTKAIEVEEGVILVGETE